MILCPRVRDILFFIIMKNTQIAVNLIRSRRLRRTCELSSQGDLQHLREMFIKVNEDMIRIRGGEPIQGRIYSLILLSETPLTQEDIATSTGYSRSQVSRFLKHMEDNAFIAARSQPGTRTILYEGRSRSFVDNFRGLFSSSRLFIQEKVRVVDYILEELSRAPPEERSRPESMKLHEAARVYSSFMHALME